MTVMTVCWCVGVLGVMYGAMAPLERGSCLLQMLDQSGNFMLIYMNVLTMHPGKGASSSCHDDASPCGHLHMPVDLQTTFCWQNDTEERRCP